jgi:hypothetical protein
MTPGIHPQDFDLALSRLLQTLDNFQGSGLTGPVGAQDAKDFARLHNEGNPIHRRKRAKTLGQTFYPDCLIHDNIENYITIFFIKP